MALQAQPALDGADLKALEQDGFAKLEERVPLDLLEAAAPVFDDVWDTCEDVWSKALKEPDEACRQPVMSLPEFVRFLDSEELLAAPRQLLGEQIQLVDYFPVYQAPRRWADGSEREPDRGWIRVPERGWHRDLTFTTRRGDRPVLSTLLFFLDDVGEEQGPTLVLPGTHLDPEEPEGLKAKEPFPGEVAVPLKKGDVLMLNGSILHSHARNRSASPRRGLVMMFAYWWVKPHSFNLPLPPAATDGASEERRRLLGLEQPAADLFIY